MLPFLKAQTRRNDSAYLDSIFSEDTHRIDHYLEKALDTSLPLKSRLLASKIAVALLQSKLLSKEELPN